MMRGKILSYFVKDMAKEVNVKTFVIPGQTRSGNHGMRCRQHGGSHCGWHARYRWYRKAVDREGGLIRSYELQTIRCLWYEADPV
jgi:hypothetical protein